MYMRCICLHCIIEYKFYLDVGIVEAQDDFRISIDDLKVSTQQYKSFKKQHVVIMFRDYYY